MWRRALSCPNSVSFCPPLCIIFRSVPWAQGDHRQVCGCQCPSGLGGGVSVEVARLEAAWLLLLCPGTSCRKTLFPGYYLKSTLKSGSVFSAVGCMSGVVHCERVPGAEPPELLFPAAQPFLWGPLSSWFLSWFPVKHLPQSE